MTTWNEAEHPRDDEGKFTYKNGGVTQEESYEDKIQRRADILFPTMKDKKDIGYVTGGAASLADDEISGVKKGEPMTVEKAIEGVNPNYEIFGNPTYKTNCQAGVAIFEARLRGFDVEVNVPYGGDLKDKLEKRPNIAFIDPATGKTPEFTKIKAKNEFDCINYLENTVQKGERYLFAFTWKKRGYDKYFTGHIITVTKDANNNLMFYDPQIGKNRNTEFLSAIKYQFDWGEEPEPPKILRVDDKEFNKEIFNQISKPASKSN